MSSSASSQQFVAELNRILEAAKAVGQALETQTYALIGGAACAILGSQRSTDDVGIVVPKGATVETRALLKDRPELFDVDNRTLHTYYKGNPPIEIEILAPPLLFQDAFDESTTVIMVDGIRVLQPALILNAKCRSILGRSSEGRRHTDAEDIKFCLGWCSKNCLPTIGEVPNATKEFVGWFIDEFGGKEIWANAGYIFETGAFEGQYQELSYHSYD